MKISSRSIAAQRVPHQPFPIADFANGLYLAKEPWLSPQNAFRRITDGRVFRGRLEKRSGSSRFSEVGIEEPTPVAGNSFIGLIRHVYLASPTTRKVIPESCTFTHLNGAGATITAEVENAAPVWVDSADTTSGFGSGYCWRWRIVEGGTDTVMGASYFYWRDGNDPVCRAEVTWGGHSGAVDASLLAQGSMAYWYNPEDEIVGLDRYQNAGGDYSIACDTNYLYVYDAAAGFYKQQAFSAAVPPNTFAGPFTGGTDDYFWFWPLDDYVVLSNFVDPVCKWDPATGNITEMDTDWTTPGTNALLRAKLVVRFRGRLLYFHTEESGAPSTLHPTRVRWTAAGSFSGWNSSTDYSDAPRELGGIQTAQFIGERLFVGFERGWMELVATGDSILPYEWRPFISRFGAVSKLSTIADNERILSRSDTTMQALDPNGQYYFDAPIPDLVQGFSPGEIDQCAATRNEDQRAFWWTYAGVGETRPEHILCATYTEKGDVAWSQYDMRFNVFSDFDSENTPTWNGLGPSTWNDYAGVTWNSAKVGVAGFTQGIGGSDKGIIHLFDSSTTDFRPEGAESIILDVVSQRLAPFPGQRAHLGWIDVYATSSSTSSLIVYVYADTQSTAYLTYTIALAPDGTNEKVYRRVPVDRSASFHRIRIVSAGNGIVEIDAIVPFFRPAGRARVFG